MTLHERIEGLLQVRERHYRDAVRLTVEIDACQDALSHTMQAPVHPAHHDWYIEAYRQAVELLKIEQEG